MRMTPITSAVLTLAISGAMADSGTDSTVFLSHKAHSEFALTADPAQAGWAAVPPVIVSTDRYGNAILGAEPASRSRWTEQALYFLFVSAYRSLYLRPNPSTTAETWGLWDWDVAEVFIGYDTSHIGRYKEFEVSPQGEWVDLDIDRDRKGNAADWSWNSGFQAKTRIDRDRKQWICEMRIPWTAIDPRPPAPGNELRLNLYRIEGAPPARQFLAWRPVYSDSFHTPERFGTLRLVTP